MYGVCIYLCVLFGSSVGHVLRPIQVIMVENSLDAIRYHLENGVHISSFYGDRDDRELLSTLTCLQNLGSADDVRNGIIRCEGGARSLVIDGNGSWG